MSALPRFEPATYEDILAVLPHTTAELINGELYTQARPKARHNRLNRLISRSLTSEGEDGDDPEGWVVVQETELHLGQPDPRSLVLVPDLCGWRKERAPDLDAESITVTPDWVCEILSPTTERHDRLRKMDQYAGLGVSWAWLVNPMVDLLEVYQLQAGLWVRVQTGGPDDELDVLPFGLRARLGRWFRRS